MHVAYIDESGDLGAAGSPSCHFILSAILVSHERWLEARLDLDGMRSNLDRLYGLRMGAEVHAAEFLGGAERHLGLDVRRRFQCAHHMLGFLRRSSCLRPVRIGVEKKGQGGRALLDLAWAGLLDEINAEISVTPPSACGSLGLLVVMDHHGALPYRPVANLTSPRALLELPFGRRSEDSHLLQCADLLGFLTKQSLAPNRHFSGSQGRGLVHAADQLYRAPCRVLVA